MYHFQLDKKIGHRLRKTSRNLYGFKFKAYEEILMDHNLVQELFDSTKDLELLKLTPFELRPLPDLPPDSLKALALSRRFRAANPLLDKCTKKMQLQYHGCDAPCFKFIHTTAIPKAVSAVGFPFGSCFDVSWPTGMSVTYYGADYGNDWHDASGFIVSQLTTGNEESTGMKEHTESLEKFACNPGLFSMSSQRPEGRIYTKARPHNDEVIVLRDGTQDAILPPFDLVPANHERNRAFITGRAPTIQAHPGIMPLRDQGTAKRQFLQRQRKDCPRRPFEVSRLSVGTGFDELLYEELLSSGLVRYEKVIPTSIIAARHSDLRKIYKKHGVDAHTALAYTKTLELME